MDYECITQRLWPHFIFSTNTHWIMNVSPTEFIHTSHSALTCSALWMYHQSHISHSALTHTLDYAVSPTDFSHTSHSAPTHTRSCMYHQQTSVTLHIQHQHTLDHACITNRIQLHFIFSINTLWIMEVLPTDFNHTSYYLYSFPWAGVSLLNNMVYIQNHYLIRYCHFLIAAVHYQIYWITALNLKLWWSRLWLQCCWRFKSLWT